jgi:hypothetical protein
MHTFLLHHLEEIAYCQLFNLLPNEPLALDERIGLFSAVEITRFTTPSIAARKL